MNSSQNLKNSASYQINHNITDEQLVAEVTKGNKNAFALIIQRYEEKLFRYAWYLVSNKIVAQDMVQEAFIKAYINLNGFNTAKKFSSWIYRITHNVCFDWLRKNRPEIGMSEDFDIASSESLEKEFSDKELRMLVRSCLDQVPSKYKVPLVLFYLEDKAYEEISEILHTSVSNVGVLINRGKKLLKSICQSQMK